MALQPCAECGVQLSDKAAACPQCGAAPKKPTKWWLWVPLISIVGILFVIMIAVGSTPEAKERAHDRDVIEFCWKEQKRPSLDPSAARFMAGACEKMESDFRQKHGIDP